METRSREIAGVGISPTEQIVSLQKPQERGRFPFQKIPEIIDRASQCRKIIIGAAAVLVCATGVTILTTENSKVQAQEPAKPQSNTPVMDQKIFLPEVYIKYSNAIRCIAELGARCF